MATVAERIAQGNEYVDRHIYALEAQTVNDLYRAHLLAYQQMKEAVEATFRRLGVDAWDAGYIGARNALLQQINQQMLILNQIEADITLNAMVTGYQAGLVGTAWSLDTASPQLRVLVPLLPTEAVRAQMLAPYVGQTFIDRFADNRADFELRIKRSLVQSQIQGETVYQAQKRIAEALGIAIGRRTRADKASNQNAFARTEMIARTELLRASNNGAMAVYERNQQVLRGYEIKAALDERTCPQQCGPLDGKQYAFGTGQRPPFHPRCRCTVLPVLIDSELERAIVGKRVTFGEWAALRGISKDQYGGVYDLKGQNAPTKPRVTA
jgi:SPP1 gp7 family putative phage head morphogenesis protein